MNFLFLLFILFMNPVNDSFASNDITFIYNDEKVETITKKDYFIPNFNDMILNREKVNLLIDHLAEQYYEQPINASMTDGGKIIAEEPGQVVNKEKLMNVLIDSLYLSRNKIELPMRTVYPKVTSEILGEISTEKLNEYMTYYREENKERSHNILLAANAINNYVVFPGEEFSFNQVVGKRTKERGYMRAPVIVKGELAEDIGGGICQVSSTLYNATIVRGLEIVERYSHSREVPYVPPGKDATVSWWGPDFVFKNNYRQPILIRASAKHGKMHVQIYSSEQINKSN